MDETMAGFRTSLVPFGKENKCLPLGGYDLNGQN